MKDYRQSFIDNQGVVFQENTAFDVWLCPNVPRGTGTAVKQEETGVSANTGLAERKQLLPETVVPAGFPRLS